MESQVKCERVDIDPCIIGKALIMKRETDVERYELRKRQAME